MNDGRNFLRRVVFFALVISTVFYSNLYANEKISLTNTQNTARDNEKMPAPPAGPYRSTKYLTTEAFKPVSTDAPPATMSAKVKDSSARESKLADKTPVANSALAPATVRQPKTMSPMAAPQFPPRFNSAPNARQWAPSAPPAWGHPQGRFAPYYPARPMMRQQSPRPNFNNRRWMPPPPPTWARRQWAPAKQYQAMPPNYPRGRYYPRQFGWQNMMPPPFRRW